MTDTVKKPRRKAANKKKKPATQSVAETIVTQAVAAADVMNAQLIARRDAAVPRGVASAAPIYAKYAENAELWDVEGNRYIDFCGGIGVLNTGHRHPAVVPAL